jgi:hypothetical protein
LTNDGILNADRDHFVLYTNSPVSSDSFVKLFHKASHDTVDKIIADIKKKIKGIKKEHNLYKYTNFIINTNIEIFKKILPRFDLVEDCKADDVYDSIRNQLINMAFEKDAIDDILYSLTGWMQKIIMERIAHNSSTIITKKEFLQYFKLLAGKIRRKELIDYALSQIPTNIELRQKVKKRPIYVQQLEFIECEQDEIIESVSDYFRADTNRHNWIEKGIIDEDVMNDFESRLCSFYENKFRSISLTENQRTEMDRGKLLLLECQKRQEMIANMTPPDRTIQGTYHVLADEEKVGWHPQWQKKLKQIKEEQNGKTY